MAYRFATWFDIFTVQYIQLLRSYPYFSDLIYPSYLKAALFPYVIHSCLDHLHQHFIPGIDLGHDLDPHQLDTRIVFVFVFFSSAG